MFLLDTNTVIHFFKGEGNVAANLLAHPPSAVALPTIVINELHVGIAKSNASEKRARQLQTLVDAVTVLPFGLQEAQTAGQVRAGLERAGTPIGRYDILIAATALTRGATLVTHSTREFGRVPGLMLRDWY